MLYKEIQRNSIYYQQQQLPQKATPLGLAKYRSNLKDVSTNSLTNINHVFFN